MDEKKLKDLRQQIDALDDRILTLLNQRAQVVVAVGKAKDESAGVYYVPSREQAIYERLVAQNAGPFPDEGVRRVFREIISASLSLEQPLKVAFLGPQATYTHVAAMRQFGLSAQLVPLKSIASIFDEVSRGRASYGVVPVENSNEGVVSHTLDMFMSSDLKVIAEILLPVCHDLLNLSGQVEDVRKVVSHPQAIGQCRNWLEENLPDIPLVDAASTATAAQQAAEDASVAAIASEAAASLYGLRVVKHKIEDNPNNFTRFLVIGTEIQAPSGRDKTSIMFSVKDQAGVLYHMLEPFSKRHINLAKIESRPMKGNAWEYNFNLDMEFQVEHSMIADDLEELRAHCQFLKVLGSYPKAQSSLPGADSGM
ncbi:MAG: prephenate dehydratase [Desulfuromonadales bacterium]